MIINDFIKCSKSLCGVGYFENDTMAVSSARTMGENQLRKFERHGIYPAAFFAYLKQKKFIKKNAYVPENKRNLEAVLDLLWDAPDRHLGVYSEGEMLRMALLLEKFPELRNKMGSAQHLWQALERDGRLFGLKGR